MQLDWQAVLDSFADAVVAADEDGQIFYVNRAAAKLLGWPADELLGQPLITIVPDRLHQSHLLGINRYLQTRQPNLIGRPVRVPTLRKDGSEIEVELTLAAYQQDGRTVFVGALRDLAERVELERQLTISRYLRAATATAARLTSRLTVDEVLQSVVDTLVTDFDGALARIWLCNPETHLLEVKASAGAPSVLANGSLASMLPETFPFEVGEVARSGKAFVQSPIAGDPRFDQEWVKREGLVSTAAFPLLCADQLLGAFVYFSRTELHPEVLQVLETFASITTAALNDAQLLVREQAARAEAERQRADAEKERDFVRRVVEYSPLGIAVTEGPEHRFTLLNPAGAKMLGLTVEELQGRSIAELALGAGPEWRRAVEGVLASGKPAVFPELAVRLPGGRILYTHVAYAPLAGPTGVPTGVIHLGLDITERKLAEQALRHQAHLLASVEQAIVATDRSGRITYWNGYAERMFGWSAGEVLGRNVLEITPSEQSLEQAEAVFKQLLTGKSWAGECLLRRRDGSTFPGWVTDTPIRDASGAVTEVIGVSSDLTELKSAESELRYQRELLRTVTDNADSALVMMDVEGHITYVNPAFTRITGYTEADVCGMKLHDAVHSKHPDGRPLPKEECPIVHAYTHLEPLRGHQETFVRKDGTHFPSVVALAPLEKHGKGVGGVLEFRDVTEEVARERALQFLVELNEATRPLTEPSEIMATATRLLGEHLEASRCAYAPVEDDEDHFVIPGDYTNGCRSIVGRYPLSTFGSRALRELRAGRPYVVHDVDREASPDEDLAAYRVTEIQAVICVSLIKAGRMAALMAVHQTAPRQWTREEVDLVELAAEYCWAYIETAEANKQLRQTAARLNLALATAKMGDWTWDIASDLTTLSDRGREIFGLPPRAVITWSELCDRLHEADRERTINAVERVLAEGGEYEQEYRIVLPDGIRWISAKGRAVLGRDGCVTGMLGVVQDITKQKQIEDSLRLADRRKDEFLAMLGHELRNPLGSISNALYVLERRMDDPAILKQYLEMLERQVALMSRLVGDMQDLSRIKTGKLMLRTEPVLLSQRMREAVETVSGVVAERKHELTVRVPKDSLYVCADAARLTQIFSNLLSNAAKYTPPGGHVWFTAERENGEVVIRVTDNGVGIAPEALPNIFELFSQSERTLGQSREGLGIGLSLVRGLVEMQGGAVTACSPGLGRGSEFVVRLPVMPSGAAGATASAAEGSHE